MSSSMDSQCLSFREIPHTTRLFSSFLEDFSQVSKYYAHPPTAEGVLSAAKEIRLDAGTRRSVVEVLREQNARFTPGNALDAATARNLDRLAAGAVAIVTGQQVGLFSGPVYSIYKAVSILRVAEEITRRGTDAVPVFWLATEDHDLAEVNHTFFNTRSGLERYDLAATEADSGRRMGEIALGAAIEALVDAAAKSLEGANAEAVGRALRESYAPDETYGSAYGKLMARIFAGRGIVFIDPLDARLHRIAAPVYRQAIEEAVPLREALMARAKELEEAGLHAQVKVTAETTLLFYNVDGRRQPLRSRDGKYFAGDAEFSAAEIARAAAEHPEFLTPNVLLRPIVQDSLLPTATYIGGPSEVAYLAQAQVVYQRVLGRMPAILPRASFTIVEAPVARFLAKYDLQFRDILQGAQHVRGAMERKMLPDDLARRFEADEEKLRAMMEAYAGPIEKLDRTLLDPLKALTDGMLFKFGKLKESVGRALNLRTGVIDSHERILFDSLYANRELQERSLSALPFLAANGAEWLDKLAEFSAPAGAGETPACAHQHHVLFL
jgi:bacillithiol biosynthesis cysteine-adding enzyme BshC